MEENKEKKNGRVGFIITIIILLIIVAAIGGYCYYLIKNPKTEYVEKEVEKSNIIENNNISNNQTNVDSKNTKSNILSEDEAMKKGKELYDKMFKYLNNMGNEGFLDNSGYVILSDVTRNEMYSILTNNAIKQLENICKYKVVNGKHVYDSNSILATIFNDTDVGGTSFEITSLSEDKVVFTVYCYSVIEPTEEQPARAGDIQYIFKDAFSIVKEQSNWKIDSIDGEAFVRGDNRWN